MFCTIFCSLAKRMNDESPSRAEDFNVKGFLNNISIANYTSNWGN